MRVVVDMDVCESNGLCTGLAPAIFELGDDDVLRLKVSELPEELVAGARAAARACPKQAIKIVD